MRRLPRGPDVRSRPHSHAGFVPGSAVCFTCPRSAWRRPPATACVRPMQSCGPGPTAEHRSRRFCLGDFTAFRACDDAPEHAEMNRRDAWAKFAAVLADECRDGIEQYVEFVLTGVTRKGTHRHIFLPVPGMPSRRSSVNSPEFPVIRVKRPLCGGRVVPRPHTANRLPLVMTKYGPSPGTSTVVVTSGERRSRWEGLSRSVSS